MKDLQEATEKICELKGELIGAQCMINALLRVLPPRDFSAVLREFDQELEAAQVVLLNSDRIGEHVLRGLDIYVQTANAIRRQRDTEQNDPS